LLLHIPPDPNVTLQEAKRVLVPGGRIGVSVMGRRENCSVLTIMQDRLVEAGFKFPGKRSPHYLADRETLIKLLEDNGFEVDFSWYDQTIDPIYDEQDLETMIFKSPESTKIVEQLDPEKRDKVFEDIKNAFKELKEKKIPLIYEQTCLVGRKPKK